ncbi:MAG: Leucine-tRNA ligase [Candidatus Gottesmanbacteria bacterium GW2011_GWA1_43_11]|uniref:Leucine--tRNA ligase n=1 Tax=Candidatus Gottesmanbacteria bacterium GW2011_GWA1_43_11 TaxID=1618436 RepID=A0A0G1CJK3_9BACT|nr:MAG: Leucine-tRNA ligase [Candidatus Gottesmanbacteria bacterium GW2011_GWA1_43_11]
MTTKKVKCELPVRFKPGEIETKWQTRWETEGIYSPDLKTAKKPYYNLMMFPYPSAEGLHVGNVYAFTGVDVHGRFMRMRGFNVFEPIGLDGFGIHSENYALKVNHHPKEQALVSQKNFYRQLRAIGNGFDWQRTLETYDPDYYRWTQWLFVQMFKAGLAYRAKAEVNWCPSCQTVLADEQVIQGKGVRGKGKEVTVSVCERCGTEVIKKELEQWFFRITAYADRLLQNTYKPSFKWPEKIKIGQRNWIGKKTGINIHYPVENSPQEVVCWTSRPDTNFGATFIVIAPEHPLASQITTSEYKQTINKYIELAKKKSKQERIAEGAKKSGVFTGAYAINRLNNARLPIWVSDFVVWGVGTGAVVGVPGHDKRDFEFAQTMHLPVKRVVVAADGDRSEITQIEQVQEKEGRLINSGFLDGMEVQEGIHTVMEYLEKKGWGKCEANYHLRDWLISRQRYWGAPIPMIYCEKCAKGKSWFTVSRHSDRSAGWRRAEESYSPQGWDVKDSSIPSSLEIMRTGGTRNDIAWAVGWYPVPEDQLPVLLPDVENWRPSGTGRGPLAGVPSFYNTKCPHCGNSAVRETDVCDTFLDSSWYFLRYPSVNSHSDQSAGRRSVEESDSTTAGEMRSLYFARDDKAELPWNTEITKRWLPVHSYIGGAEHTVLHLLYARFVWMVLRDMGYIPLENEGLSDDYNADEPFQRFYAHGLIIKDGAKMSKSKGNVVVPDAYIKLYGADTLRTYLMFLGPFDQGGDFTDTGIAGMYRWLSRVWRLVSTNAKLSQEQLTVAHDDRPKLLHKTIKGVTDDMKKLRYNTAIAKLMELVNWWMDHATEMNSLAVIDFLKLLAPFAPHMAEELYQRLRVANPNDQIPMTTKNSLHLQPWPTYDLTQIAEESITIVIQVNGKLRDSLVLSIQNANDQELIEQTAKQSAKVAKWLAGKQINKTIFVPGKLINFVVKD